MAEQSLPVATRDDFADWLQPHVDAMAALASRLAVPGDGDDVTQDSVLIAWSKRAKFDPARGTARAWLLAIVASEARRSWRRRRPVLMPTMRDSIRPDTDDHVGVRDVIALLAWRQRQAIALFYYLDLPISEVAQAMGCQEGTVKATLHAARQRIKKMMVERS